jgi:hypothetical protein
MLVRVFCVLHVAMRMFEVKQQQTTDEFTAAATRHQIQTAQARCMASLISEAPAALA